MELNLRPHRLTRRGLLGLGVVVGCAQLSRSANAQIQQPAEATPGAFIERAFEMRDLAVEQGDQPYGAVIVGASGEIVGQAPSRVVSRGDPTAHAEMEAIRDASHRLGVRDLSAFVMYSSSRPCPMCEAAAYWGRLSGMFFGSDGAAAGQPVLCR